MIHSGSRGLGHQVATGERDSTFHNVSGYYWTAYVLLKGFQDGNFEKITVYTILNQTMQVQLRKVQV